MTKRSFILIIGISIIALAIRLPRLKQRPMHGDEAVHAIKFGDLLESGMYEYNTFDYHGPTLNYFTLIPAKLAGVEKLVEVNEFILFIVPIFFGVLLVLLVLLIGDGLGPKASVVAAFLTSVSPAMVFYSRYYIQEMLLVCFTFGVIVSGYRYCRSGKVLWAILTGIFAGLMHATKETCIIAFGSMVIALIVMLIIGRKKASTLDIFEKIKPWHIIAGLVSAVIVSVLFFSSFFTNPKGIIDSILTYTTYLDRAKNNDLHIHPWYYYLKILTYYKLTGGPVWTEVIIVILALIGFAAAFMKKEFVFGDIRLVRFIGIYTLLMTIIYSSISYKTPWCLLSFLHGMILLAGLGAVILVKIIPKVLPRYIMLVLLFGGFCHLIWLSFLNNYRYYAESGNPYVYAHPTVEIFTAIEKIEYYAGFYPLGRQVDIDVICPGHDYWPLPWYLRSFPNAVFTDHVIPDKPVAPLVLAFPEFESDLTKRFYDDSIPFEQRYLYMRLFEENPYYIWLRPEVKLTGYVRKDLWDAAHREQNSDILIESWTEQ